MKLAVPAERAKDEPRVAATPETVKRFIGLGCTVTVEAGAGEASRIPDQQFKDAGASIAKSAAAAVKDADIVLKVRRPTPDEARAYRKGAVVAAIMDPWGDRPGVEALARAGVTAFSMEFLPRITRAQSMDVLSSQANLAGYRAVIDGSAAFDRALPMMMTAAGTVQPARIFVMGAGVAGLQAIATARRLGAIVTATDVRPAAKEQVESLGAKFIAVEDEEFRQAETAGGYAKEMSAEYRKKQAELVASHIARQDIVITTALIPGRPAPKLVTKDMVESMAPGSVVVDLAVERGGNCELSKPGQVAEHKGVKIIGHVNMPGRVATSASALYARNLLAFVSLMIKDGKLAIDWDDQIIAATALTRDGGIVHPQLAGDEMKTGAKAPAAKPRRSPAKKPATRTKAAAKGAAASGTSGSGTQGESK